MNKDFIKYIINSTDPFIIFIIIGTIIILFFGFLVADIRGLGGISLKSFLNLLPALAFFALIIPIILYSKYKTNKEYLK